MSPYQCSLTFRPIFSALPDSGGDERDRTDDPLLAKQVLSQLSYTPAFCEPQKLNNEHLRNLADRSMALCHYSLERR